jgi:hypothetical protein
MQQGGMREQFAHGSEQREGAGKASKKQNAGGKHA